MRAFSYSLLKLVEVLKELISLGSVYEEEDHQPLICGFRYGTQACSQCCGDPDPQGADSPPLSTCSEDRKNLLKGLSHEIDFKNVVENGQILALIRAAAGFLIFRRLL
jgi:hypothetical protein